MKKKISLMLAMVAFAACLFAISVSAVVIDGIDYSFSGTEATVTSENQSCQLTVVNIPETVTYEDVTYTVTKIGNSAFKGNTVVTTITTPSTIKDIREHAFREMTALTSVTLNANTSFKAFRDAEFYQCKALKSVDMSGCQGLTGIGDGGTYDDTFFGCASLERVVFPQGISYIGVRAFTDCKKLGDIENLNFENVTYVGFKAFWGPKLTGDVVLSPNATYVGSHAFRETNITSIVMRMSSESTQTTMDDATFYNCKNLKFVVLPNNIQTIGSYTFQGCSSLEYVVLGSNVQKFSTKETFKNCGALKAIIYQGSLESFEALTGVSALGTVEKAPFSNYKHGTLPSVRTVYYGATTCEKCNGIFGEEGFLFTNLMSEMRVGKKCIHCDFESVTESFAPVFESLGYSKSLINGSGAIACGFRVNYTSINKYNEVFAENAIGTFGVYAVAESKLTGDTIFDESGNLKAGVLNSEIKSGHTYFDIKVINLSENGVTADGITHLDATIYLGAYVYVGNSVYYIGDGVTTAVGEAVSFNSIQNN